MDQARYGEPWTFREDLFDDNLNPCVLDANGDAVCSVEYRGDEDEQEATGHLIAAAPDLLEALKAVENSPRVALGATLRRTVRAAIAKATAPQAEPRDGSSLQPEDTP